jgi:hypothetical protein
MLLKVLHICYVCEYEYDLQNKEKYIRKPKQLLWSVFEKRNKYHYSCVVLWTVTLTSIKDLWILVHFSTKIKPEKRHTADTCNMSSLMNIFRPDICSYHCCHNLNLLIFLEITYLSLAQHLLLVFLILLAMYYNLQCHYVNYCLYSSYPKAPVPFIFINTIILLINNLHYFSWKSTISFLNKFTREILVL